MQLDLRGPAGRLEALLEAPRSAPRFAAIVCHPHPLHGGAMSNPATYRLAKAVRAQGGIALRFNFRGVGKSEGVHAGGAGEIADARAALDRLALEHAALPRLACGYSFGAWVALEAAREDTSVLGVLCAGLPISLMGGAADAAQRLDRAVAVVQAEQDQFGPPGELESALAASIAPRRLSVVKGTTHLFAQELPALEREATAALGWLLERAGVAPEALPAPPGGHA